MKRVVAALLGVALLPLAAGPAQAAPNIYHTIISTHANATLTQLDGCILSEVFVSSSVAKYASQPGPVNKQGLTAVFVRVSDTCTSTPAAAAAAPGGGNVLFQANGQNHAALTVDQRLTKASVTTSLAGEDGNGDPVTIELDASWIGTGELEHTTLSSHENIPGVGNVNATDNNLRRPAEATVSVSVDGRTITGTDSGAVLEQVKSRCIEVAHPGVDGFYPCFGFPG